MQSRAKSSSDPPETGLQATAFAPPGASVHAIREIETKTYTGRGSIFEAEREERGHAKRLPLVIDDQCRTSQEKEQTSDLSQHW